MTAFQHRFSFALIALVAFIPWANALAQSSRPSRDASRGNYSWRATSKTGPATRQAGAPRVQTVHYQAQGSLPSNAGALPSNNGLALPTGPRDLPPMPSLNPGASSGSTDLLASPPQLPAMQQELPLGRPSSPPPASLSDSYPGTAVTAPVLPPDQILPTQGPIHHPTNHPSGLNEVNPPPHRGIPGQLASHAQGAGAQTGAPRTNNPQAGNALRAIENRQNTPNPPAGRLNPQSITTGLPFVTPAPGRYPTSPYNHAMFQTAAYQRIRPVTQQASPPPGQLASTVTTQSTRQPVLPQYQYTQPVIYPTAYQCAPPAPTIPTTGAVPGTYVPPTLTPNLTPGLYSPDNSGYAPLFSLGQENYNVQLGRGIIGQPTVYVPGQPVRNFLRYLFP